MSAATAPKEAKRPAPASSNITKTKLQQPVINNLTVKSSGPIKRKHEADLADDSHSGVAASILAASIRPETIQTFIRPESMQHLISMASPFQSKVPPKRA